MRPRTLLTHPNIYFFGLVLLAISLPLSIFTTSLAEILLFVNWVTEGNFRKKGQMLKKQPAIWLISGLYLLHLFGLLYTSDFSYALHDLKTKLPILLLPLIIGTSGVLSRKEIKYVLLFFVSAVFSSGLVSVFVFYGIIPIEYYDIRDISIFISHIRLSLMVSFSIYILIYYSYFSPKELRFSLPQSLYILPVFLFLILFLFLLKSLTGIIIFTIVSLLLAWIASTRIPDIAPRFIVRALILVIPLLIVSYLAKSIEKYYSREEVDFNKLEKYSALHNPYSHDTLRRATENGNYVWLYLNEEELRSCWNARSDFDYDSLDRKQQRIKHTLIRFLTSKGYRKDCSGVNSLSDDEVQAIENGMANYIFMNHYSLYPRIYETIWEIDSYRRGGDPSNHSLTQRIAYLKAARNILSSHFFFGTGTGDVQDEFNRYYKVHNSPLNTDNRRRAHNQYVTFFITFGLIGFVFSMIFIFLPVFYEKGWNDFLFLVFFIIVLLSMLNEDTLETQTGVSFFIFFYSILLIGRGKRNRINHEEGISEKSD